MTEHNTDDNSNQVKSVTKAFLIMEELDKSGELSIGDLSERLRMDKATVHRLVNTVKTSGFVIQNPDNKKYANSLKLLAMGNRVMGKLGVKRLARTYMEELSEKTGETVNLGSIVDNRIIYIDKLVSSSTIKVDLGVGVTVPIYCSGMGKAILAYTPDSELEGILKSISFERFTASTITNRARLMEEFAKIRRDGFAVDDEEYIEGLVCFGAPIFDFDGIPVAAISISCPKYRYDPGRHLMLYTGMVAQAGRDISKMMGYTKK
ncbi:MAG TPA: IclR family transcriptional regulator [Anaerovoracaceae bacterium]|nr:IclR family transcriptional regulator [Anaerovoracaceae bacterium]